MSEPIKREIMIRGTAGGGKTVQAVIVGPFGIHPAWTWGDWSEGDGYSITHIATGYKLPYAFGSEAGALKVADRLRRSKRVSWRMRREIPKAKWKLYQSVANRAVRGVESWTT